MIKFLRNALYEPSILNKNSNSKEIFHEHKKNLLKKKLLYSAFSTTYKTIISLSDKFFKIKERERVD